MSEDPAQRPAHPGAFCSPIGATGMFSAGTPALCNAPEPGKRARWRRNPAFPAAARGRRRRTAVTPAVALPRVDAITLPPAAEADVQRIKLLTLAHELGTTVNKLKDAVRWLPKFAEWDFTVSSEDAAKIRQTMAQVAQPAADFSPREVAAAMKGGLAERIVDVQALDDAETALARHQAAGDPIAADQTAKLLGQYRKGMVMPEEMGQELALIDARAKARREPVPLPTVSGAPSTTPKAVNGWGYDLNAPVHYHEDGPIGGALRQMGDDQLMDVDGEPLYNVLGKTATDVVTGRKNVEEGIDAYIGIRDRLPEGSRARQALSMALQDMQTPDRPIPAMPERTPEPMVRLMTELRRYPMVRNDPKEIDELARIADEFAAGRTGGRQMITSVRQIANRWRHESLGDVGKFRLDDTIRDTADALEKIYKEDREALRPPR